MSKIDCGFTTENSWFRYRTGGILIKDDKMLFIKSNEENYYYMIGGAVHHGETSKSCIEREIFEESGIMAHAKYLAVVCENFFKGRGGKIDGLDCHTLEFYYFMEIENLDALKEKTDTGEELIWLTLDDIEKNNIKPAFIKERIREILNSKQTIHILEERDR